MKNLRLIAIFVLLIIIASGVVVIQFNSTKNITGNVVSNAEQSNIADTYSGSYDYDYGQEAPYEIWEFSVTANWNLMAKTVSGVYNGVYNLSGDASYEKKRLSGEPTNPCSPDSGTNTIQCLDSACKLCTTFHPEDDWGWWCNREWRTVLLNAYTPYDSENLNEGRVYTCTRFKIFRSDGTTESRQQANLQAWNFCRERKQECMSSRGDVSIECTGCHISVPEPLWPGRDYTCTYDNSFNTEAEAMQAEACNSEFPDGSHYRSNVMVSYWKYNNQIQCQNEAYTREDGKWCKNLKLNSYSDILINLGLNARVPLDIVPCSDFSLLIEKGLINDPSLNLYGLFDLHHGFYSFDKADQPEKDGKWCRGTLTQNGGIGNHGVDFFVNKSELTQEERDSKIINLAFTQDGLIGNPHKSAYTGPAWIYLEEGDKLGCSFFASSTDGITIKSIWLQDENGNVIISAENQVIAPEDNGYIKYQFNYDVSLYSEDNLISGKRIKCSAVVKGKEGEEAYIESDYLPVIERNIKDKSKYTPTSVFMISSEDKDGKLDWRRILQSIPAAIWKNSSWDNVWCNKLKDLSYNAEKDAIEEINLPKCGYPLLIDETSAEEKEEKTDEATFGNAPAAPVDESTTSYDIDEFQEDNSLSYKDKTNDKLWWQGQWKEKGLVVVVDYNNYTAGLFGAQLAAYLNAPLMFVGEENRNEWEKLLKNKMIVVAGIVDSYLLSDNIALDYNAGKLVIFNFDAAFLDNQHYINLFGRGRFSSFESKDELNQFMKELGMDESKLVVVNPEDINETYCEKNSQGEKKDYCGMSVLGSYEASAEGDKLVTIETTQSAPGYIEIENKMIEWENENNKDNPDEAALSQLEDEIDNMAREVEDNAEEIHGEMQKQVYSETTESFNILAAPTAIPNSVPGDKIGGSYDKYYRDPSGNLDCCEQGSVCCECEVTPKIFGDRSYAKSLSEESGEISAGIFGLPACDKESAASDSGNTITGAITGMATFDNPVFSWEWKRALHRGRSAFLAGLIEAGRRWSVGINPVPNIYFPYVKESAYEQLGGGKVKKQPLPEYIENSLNKDYAITKIDDDNYCRLNKMLLGEPEFISYDGPIKSWPTSTSPHKIEPNDEEVTFAVGFYYSLMSKIKLGMLSSIQNVEQMDYLLQGAGTQTYWAMAGPDWSWVQVNEEIQSELGAIVLNDKVQELLPEVKQGLSDAKEDALDRIKGKDERERIISETADALSINEEHSRMIDINQKLLKAKSQKTPGLSSEPPASNTKEAVELLAVDNAQKLTIDSEQRRRLIDASKIKYPWIREDTEFTRAMTRAMAEKDPRVTEDPENIKEVEKAVISYLIESRRISLRYIELSQSVMDCIHNTDIGVNKPFFDECNENISRLLLMSVPNIQVSPPNGSEKDGKEIAKAQIMNTYLLRGNDYFKITKDIQDTQNVWANLAGATVVTVVTAGLGTIPGLIVNGLFLIQAVESTSEVCHEALVRGYSTNIGGEYLQDDSGIGAKYKLGPDSVKDASSCIYAAALSIGPFLVAPVAGKAVSGDIAQNTARNIVNSLKKRFPGAARILNEDLEKFTARLMVKSGKGCFLAGTKIKMADGSEKNIEEIKEGEKVAAWDINVNKKVEADVTKTFKREADKYFIIDYENVD
jgi:hypothetical protein